MLSVGNTPVRRGRAAAWRTLGTRVYYLVCSGATRTRTHTVYMYVRAGEGGRTLFSQDCSCELLPTREVLSLTQTQLGAVTEHRGSRRLAKHTW